MNKTVAIIQSRLGSTRLPNKVLKDICGKPMLWHQVKRIGHAKNVHCTVVATTTTPTDDTIVQFCQREGFDCFRGQEDDVLDRYYRTAKSSAAECIVRLTADCPLVDPEIVDDVVNLLLKTESDYASNVNPPTYPDGLDVEVFTFRALETAWQNAKHKYQREHVTSYITENPTIFKIVNLTNKTDLSGWRLTVDEPEDFEVISIIYKKLYQPGAVFGLEEIAAFLTANPDVQEINRKFMRDANYDTNDK